ncbi:MAG TPA: YbaB/EbfC family nucleoid-associated protein [Beijerinckiaceae bacterium]|nr:YbaB/EbfC family nucleoid-associated protein [Beijerinckiaceae bacterium]
MMGMMKQVQAMQAKFAEMQAELEQLEVEGSSGGGMVKVVVLAKGALKSIRIDPSLMQPDEAEILEDLIVAACNDARGKAEALLAEKMKALTGGLPLPPGLKLF